MKNKKNKGLVYTVNCKATGKLYVGATTKSLQERKADHENRAERGEGNYFSIAIATLGPENFEWEVTTTVDNIDELARKEKEIIANFNSKKDGYNSDSGGGFKKSVYQYDMSDGGLICKYDCLESAGKDIGATKQQLSRACLSSNKIFNGFYWSYDYEEPFKPEQDKRKKSIVQLDMNNFVLAIYNSVIEASRQTSINRTSIAKVCRGERNHAGGYKWLFDRTI